jgi:hypothetical protein
MIDIKTSIKKNSYKQGWARGGLTLKFFKILGGVNSMDLVDNFLTKSQNLKKIFFVIKILIFSRFLSKFSAKYERGD